MLLSVAAGAGPAAAGVEEDATAQSGQDAGRLTLDFGEDATASDARGVGWTTKTILLVMHVESGLVEEDGTWSRALLRKTGRGVGP
jgi:hypothetical protein